MGFKVEWENGADDDEVFDTYEEAEEHARQGVSDYHLGAEILHLSNSGDYPEDDEDDDPEYEIVEVDN